MSARLARGLLLVAVGLFTAAVLPWDALIVFLDRQPRVTLVLGAAAVLCAVVGVLLRLPVKAADRGQVIPWWWALLAGMAVVATICLTTVVLIGEADRVAPASERAKARLDAVRTGLAAGAGAGAAMALLLAFRRQRYQEVVAVNADHDAAEKRITELYTKAVEQLGSEKAAVRLGALYALERLGQDHPDHRQTTVNVLCAYLRMPHDPGTGGGERQVRLTAQGILAAHLRETAESRYWAGASLDLTGATLVDLDLTGCRVQRADFTEAEFHGDARFDGAAFAETARFDRAGFRGVARFSGARFTGQAWFYATEFHSLASFDEAVFADACRFEEAAFGDTARFDEVDFRGVARFDGAEFGGAARFHRSAFAGVAMFSRATFADSAWFDMAMFHDLAGFGHAIFHGDAGFDLASFAGTAGFTGASFQGRSWFDSAEFRDEAKFDGASFADRPPS